MARLRPSFLIIGAQKAGTSALYTYLLRHPQIIGPSNKELNFFWQDRYYEKGVAWYAQQFPILTPDADSTARITFEATPHYLHSQEAPARIWRYNPKMRLIVLLREPLRRAWSQFQMYQLKRQNRAGLRQRINKYEGAVSSFFANLLMEEYFCDFAACLQTEAKAWQRDRLVVQPAMYHQGLYGLHLRHFLKYFSRQQLLIIDSKRLKEVPKIVLQEVESFLNLQPGSWGEDSFAPVNANHNAPPLPVSPELSDIFKNANKELFQLLGQEFTW